MVKNGNPLAYTGNILSTVNRSGDRSLNITGEATMVNGFVNVPAPYLRPDMQIFLSRKTEIGTGAGNISVGNRVDGVLFNISSYDPSGSTLPPDDSVVSFVIVKNRD